MANRSKSLAGFERRHEISAGGLIWRRNSAGGIEVILVKPAGKEYWTLPKGHVEKGESIAQAALREVREETGLTVADDAKPLGDVSYVYSWHENPGSPLVRVFKSVHFFLMELQGGDTSAHDSEIDQVAWVGLEEAGRTASFENERRLISKAAAMIAA